MCKFQVPSRPPLHINSRRAPEALLCAPPELGNSGDRGARKGEPLPGAGRAEPLHQGAGRSAETHMHHAAVSTARATLQIALLKEEYPRTMFCRTASRREPRESSADHDPINPLGEWSRTFG